MEDQRFNIQAFRRRFIEFLRQGSLAKDEKKPVEELEDTFAGLLITYPKLQNDLTQLLPDYRTESSSLPIPDPDIKDLARCSPSYCLLPEDYPIPLASNREEHGILALNDLLVAVTWGSKDHPSGNTSKNKYQHTLFRYEDHRFELDMLYEITNAAVASVEKLLKDIEKLDIPIRLEDHLTVGDIRCIKSLYGERWSKAKDYFREYLPNLVTQLKRRKEMWGKYRTSFNKKCPKEYAKYFSRSLDNRSSEFKKPDFESLRTGAILSEIESKGEFDVQQYVSSGKEQQILIHRLELQYPDIYIHQDTHLLIRSAFENRHGPDKFTPIWTRFLEKLLSPPTQVDEAQARVRRISGQYVCVDEHIDDGQDNDSRLFYGNESFYVLIKLYYILYERLQKAKLWSCSAANPWKMYNDKGSEYCYARFNFAVINAMDGRIDQERFEDECLTILGPESYILFTLPKLILRIVEQMRFLANHELDLKLIEVFEQELARKPRTVKDDNNYLRRARLLVPDMNLFRLEYMPAERRLSIQLMKFKTDRDADCHARSLDYRSSEFKKPDFESLRTEG